MGDLQRLLGLAGDVRVDLLDSPALRANPLGDPAVRPVPVYTPPGYDPQGSARYPVLYCLHGYTGNATGLLGARPWETNVVQWADRLIGAGTMPPALVVLVDGFTRLGGSQYVDSIHNGPYAQYVVRDVIGHVDANYRSVAHEGGRAVLGKSSGGFGAVHLCMVAPGTFAAFASHSGDSYFPYAHPISFPTVQRTLEGFDGIAAFVAAFEQRAKRPGDWYTTIEMLGYGAAYSPAAAAAFAIDLPLDLQTGELREDVFARWRAFDPVERAAPNFMELARLRVRYLDCGRRDEYGLDIGARVFAARMRALDLEVHHEEFDDDHRNIAYRYATSLPLLAGALDRD